MKIIGIDSSTKNCGYAVYDGLRLVESGNYRYPGYYDIEKLRLIVADFNDLIAKHNPDAVLIEETVPVRNGRSVTSLNQVAGAIMAVAYMWPATVGAIPPSTIKKVMDIKTKEDSISLVTDMYPSLPDNITDHESDAILLVETYLRMENDQTIPA